jgi:hypothetical protein
MYGRDAQLALLVNLVDAQRTSPDLDTTEPVSTAVVSRDRPGLACTTASTKTACHDGCKHRGCRLLASRNQQDWQLRSSDAWRGLKGRLAGCRRPVRPRHPRVSELALCDTLGWDGRLTNLIFRVGHAIRAHPWIQVVLGVLLVGAGALAVLVGAGHGGLIAAGALVLVGGVTAARGGRGRALKSPDDEAPEDRAPNPPRLPD